ncbi:hypothetical protein LOTGIDRAFT_127889, partial [Lottia gigantea]
CSVTCGDGEETRDVYCGEKDDPSDDLLCQEQEAPDAVRDCYKHECPLEWSVGDWSPCSQSCGEGLRYRNVFCGVEEEDYDDYRCVEEYKPSDTKPCFLGDCPLEWTVGEWQECSQSCGEGMRYRDVFCGVEEDYDDYLCNEEIRPSDTQPCFLRDCPVEWTVGEWQECSKTCGTGIEKRVVYCGDEEDETDDHLCSNDPPSATKFCNKGKCKPLRRPRCEKDKYSFCRTANAKKCIFGGFKKICCKSCSKLAGAAYRRIAALRRFAKARRQSKRRRRFRSRLTRRKNRRRS